LVDGVFFSSLICENNGLEEMIDTRTSDAIALAVRFQTPIYTYENILDKAGIYLKADEEISFEEEIDEGDSDEIEISFEENTTTENDFFQFSLRELQEKLNVAVTNEDYELAAKIRDEISKR